MKQLLYFFALELLKLLDKRFSSNPPFDKTVHGRKLLAKFIGLALYKAGRECVMTRGPDCSIEGPCCLRHRAEGICEAHDMFNDLLRVVDEYISGNSAFNTTIQAIQIELKMRVVLDHLSYSASMEHNIPDLLETLISKYFNGNAYASEKLNVRASILRDIVQNNLGPALPSILETKFPFSLFEGNLRNFLKSIDALFPQVLLSGFIAGNAADDRDKMQRSTSDILSVSRAASKLDSPIRDIAVAREPSILQTPTKQIYATAENEEEPKPLSPIKILSPPANKRHRPVLSPPRKPVANIAAPEVADERNPFAGVKISGKFFRGVLEPSDERFAAIADGTDPQCKQFIIDRARKAASIFVRTLPPKPAPVPKAVSKAASKTEESPELSAKSTSMLDRHASAQRIAWESQMSPASSAPRTASKEQSFDQIQLISNADPDAIQRVRLPSRARRRFTDEETSSLIEGYKRFGADWKSILKHYKFDNRTNVDLKDKARNLLKHGLL
jgi:hypothetical protein